MFNTGDITLVCTSKYFQPESEHFDDTFKFIGPSIADRNNTGDFPIESLKGRRTIFIYFMGTVVNEQPEFYSHCLKAFADIDALVVMSNMGRGLIFKISGTFHLILLCVITCLNCKSYRIQTSLSLTVV